MTLPFAALYDIVLGAHQISGMLLLLIAVALTVLAVLSRNQEGLFGHALVLVKLCDPLFGLVVLTGAYQLIDLGIGFFQGWVIGALLFGVAFIGILHAYWRPQAKRIAAGELQGERAKRTCNELAGAGGAMIVLILLATYLMERGAL